MVTSVGEGIVKRINVRATEVETFDRSSIIIPNSNFINNPVVNGRCVTPSATSPSLFP